MSSTVLCIFINIDDIVHALIHNYFPDEFASLKTNPEKVDFYWAMRRCTFDDILKKFPHLSPKNVIDTIFSFLFKSIDLISPSEMTLYMNAKHRSTTVLENQVVLDVMKDIGSFIAKYRNHNYMLEVSGRGFDDTWTRSFFDVYNILQIVFVSSADTLVQRVSGRSQQLVNAPEHMIRSTYDTAYFDAFTAAVRSQIFNEIIVDVNDDTATTVLHLKRMNVPLVGGLFAKFPYAIVQATPDKQRSRPPTQEEMAFLRRLFENTGMPAEFINIGRPLQSLDIQMMPVPHVASKFNQKNMFCQYPYYYR